jgi:hypothetical protein
MDVRNSTCSVNESSWHEASRSTPGFDLDHEMCVRALFVGHALRAASTTVIVKINDTAVAEHSRGASTGMH